MLPYGECAIDIVFFVEKSIVHEVSRRMKREKNICQFLETKTYLVFFSFK